jgi:hypothetical protein
MKHHVMWCVVCDTAVVDSAIPETGTFYSAQGHQWSAAGEFRGDYHIVLFAVCNNCKLENAVLKHVETKE